MGVVVDSFGPRRCAQRDGAVGVALLALYLAL